MKSKKARYSLSIPSDRSLGSGQGSALGEGLIISVKGFRLRSEEPAGCWMEVAGLVSIITVIFRGDSVIWTLGKPTQTLDSVSGSCSQIFKWEGARHEMWVRATGSNCIFLSLNKSRNHKSHSNLFAQTGTGL